MGFISGLKVPDTLGHKNMVSSFHLKCSPNMLYAMDCVGLDANIIRKNKNGPTALQGVTVIRKQAGGTFRNYSKPELRREVSQ